LTSLKKSDGPVSDSGCSNFDSFRVKTEGKENTRKFYVQACLRHGKGESHIKEQTRKKLKLNVEVAKTGWSNFINRMFWYFLCGYNPIRSVLERFSYFHVKRVTSFYL
jgi:hypothetical protein